MPPSRLFDLCHDSLNILTVGGVTAPQRASIFPENGHVSCGAERERKAVLEFPEKLKCCFFSFGGEETALAPNFLQEILICCSRISPHNGFSLLPTKFHPKTKWTLSLPKPCKGERNQIEITHSQGNGSHVGLIQKRGVTAPPQAGNFYWLLKNLTNFGFPRKLSFPDTGAPPN